MNLKRVKQTKATASSEKELQEILTLHGLIASREDLRELYKQGVNEFVNGVALLAIKAVIDAEVESKCGKPHERSSTSPCYRHGKQNTGFVIINGQKKHFEKPRIVTRGNQKNEASLETYHNFQRNSIMEASVMAKMLHGVSTRDYRQYDMTPCLQNADLPV